MVRVCVRCVCVLLHVVVFFYMTLGVVFATCCAKLCGTCRACCCAFVCAFVCAFERVLFVSMCTCLFVIYCVMLYGLFL